MKEITPEELRKWPKDSYELIDIRDELIEYDKQSGDFRSKDLLPPLFYKQKPEVGNVSNGKTIP